MAQRLIHLLFCEKVLDEVKDIDRERFALGNILPDAYADGSMRDATHFLKTTENGAYAYFDWKEFRASFGNLILSDDLYLGYFLHLVVDAFYRYMLYSERDLRSKITNKEDVKILHNDYRLINPYIVHKYGIQTRARIPEDWEKESIHQVAAFRVEPFLDELEKDYLITGVGETKFVTEQLLDEFFEIYAPECVKEIKSVKKNEEYLSPFSFKYEYIDMK